MTFWSEHKTVVIFTTVAANLITFSSFQGLSPPPTNFVLCYLWCIVLHPFDPSFMTSVELDCVKVNGKNFANTTLDDDEIDSVSQFLHNTQIIYQFHFCWLDFSRKSFLFFLSWFFIFRPWVQVHLCGHEAAVAAGGLSGRDNNYWLFRGFRKWEM